MTQYHIRPTYLEFKKLARHGNYIPVYLNMMADEITPVSLINSSWKKSKYSFLLESVIGGEKLGRHSFLSTHPEVLLEERKGGTFITTFGQKKPSHDKRPLKLVLKEILKKYRAVSVPGLPHFIGGAVGYFSYETVHTIENIPKSNPDVLNWPQACFMIAKDLFIFDNTQQLLYLVSGVSINKKSNLKKIYASTCNRLMKNLGEIKKTKISSDKTTSEKSYPVSPFRSNMDAKGFESSVKQAKEYISQGDIIQVVISRRNEKKTQASPLDIYRALRVINPSPYMTLIKLGNRSLIGSSPEPLVKLEQGVASTRPIAGTRKRGETELRDVQLEKELLKDPKERAEHIMLVDLGRNDLGRVCRKGTIRVPLFMKVERYSHVMHIVSEVRGKMAPGKDAFDLFDAAFPAGTVSGAPKIRAMEIIDELEADQRGPYSGAIGYFSFTGDMDLAITIRTILWDRGRVSIQTGAGIVADSHPHREFLETENKAAGLKATIELAEKGQLFWGRS